MMEPIYVWGLLAIAQVISAGVIFYLSNVIFSQNRKIKEFNEARKKSMLDDLELATSEQLLTELRKRSGLAYLLVMPVNNEDKQGITIDIHNIPPVPCFHMLRLATSFTFHELKSHGVEIPDSEEEEGESWK
jgi:hypothetical protein